MPPGPIEPLLAGLVAFGLTAWLAVEGGGFGVVERQEAGLAIWWLLALGFAFGLLPRWRPARDVRTAAAAIGALAILMAIGLLGTESVDRTGIEISRTLTYAGILSLVWLGIGRETWRGAAIGLGAAALAIPVLAVVSRLDPSLVGDPGLDPLLGGRRLAYPLGYWNAVGVWSASAFAVGVAWSSHERRPLLRAIGLAALPVAGLAAYLTYSRGSIVAVLVGTVVVVVAARGRASVVAHTAIGLAGSAALVLVVRTQPQIRDGVGTDGAWVVAVAIVLVCLGCGALARRTRRSGLDRRTVPLPGARPAAAALALALVVAAVLAAGADSNLAAGSYPKSTSDPATRLLSIDGNRGQVWGSAVDAFAADPVTGLGAGTFQFWWDRDPDHGEELRDAHSLYLETLAELGLPGLVALLALLAALLAGAIRAHRGLRRSSEIGPAAGLLAAAVIFCVAAGFDWLWEFPALVLLGLGGAAVVGAARSPWRRAPWRLGPARLALVALAVVAGAAQIPGLVAANRSQAAEDAFAAGLHDRGIELAGDAIEAEPWSADAHALRGYLLLDRGEVGAAREDASDAVRLEPTNWRHRLLLARVEIAAGDPDAARAALEQLVALRPAAGLDPDQLLGGLQSDAG